MLATDIAMSLAKEGLPFREAYKVAAAKNVQINQDTVAESLINRVSTGGCGQLATELLEARLSALKN